MLVHRICKARFASRDLEPFGIGAARYGGRWNSVNELRDRRLIYTSSQLALACLEVLVHTGGVGLRSEAHVRLTFELDADAVQELPLKEVGSDWRSFSETPQSQGVGDAWYDGLTSPVLRVPSIVMPDELYSAEVGNYLIHARHPRAAQTVRLVDTVPFVVDDRLR
ncbi:RES family NAD+ phosphorylase [Deinococcus sp. QL22]|uniref:RES family NAD+ phosphorylase n=1 Tax=Deinococcus sp. QL22 TaxID=2939437 RepID=UPI0020172162|nr:RES family NAD+ phosphorylase [Deinococcus sp. QL22]UQN08827.1 RES family NAD+ phosphorylase [Deinococcus sp. QL22]